jgi:hypothetical protein
MKKPMILIIHTDTNLINSCVEKLWPQAEVIKASVNDALIEFRKGNISHIIINGDEKLIKEIRKDFKGPMIATSNYRGYCNLMMHWGCNFKSTPGEAADFVSTLIFVELFLLRSEDTLNYLLNFDLKNPRDYEEIKELVTENIRESARFNFSLITDFLKDADKILTSLKNCPVQKQPEYLKKLKARIGAAKILVKQITLSDRNN